MNCCGVSFYFQSFKLRNIAYSLRPGNILEGGLRGMSGSAPPLMAPALKIYHCENTRFQLQNHDGKSCTIAKTAIQYKLLRIELLGTVVFIFYGRGVLRDSKYRRHYGVRRAKIVLFSPL